MRYVALVVTFILCLGIFPRGSALNVPSGTWGPAASLPSGRTGSASVLLRDGRVLVTGGERANGIVATADLYDSLGDVFTAAAPMNHARRGHSAVVLDDGRVLVAGGATTGEPLTNSAEIYDPATGSWSATGDLVDRRVDATASLLNDGRVLIAGGAGAAGALASLEIFDPVSNSFSYAGQMVPGRSDHAAAVLQDGRVLIMGGTTNGSTSLASVEIFDPETSSVSPGPELSTARAGHSATTLLDGRVLVVGGVKGKTDLATAEIYDPQTGSFSPTGGKLQTARRDHLAFLLPHNNTVLMVGGTSKGVALSSAELFVPWLATFKSTGWLTTPREQATGAPLAIDGLLLVAGGKNTSGRLTSAERYGFATVRTDKGDYAPGEIVTITGSGWEPGETVTLRIQESPAVHPDQLYTAKADSSGRIVNTGFQTASFHFGVRFYLTATGTRSQAQTTFSDGFQFTVGINPTTVASATPRLITLTVQNISAGSFPLECVVVNIPAGAGTPTGLSVAANDPGPQLRGWFAPTVKAGKITTKRNGGATNAIDPGGTVAISFTTTATTTGIKTWTTNAYGSTDCLSSPFPAPDLQPTVDVTAGTGTIVIVKDTLPSDSQDFTYSTSGGLTPSAFTLDDDDSQGADGAAYSNTQTFSGLAAGSYSVTEGVTAGWILSPLACADPSGGTSTTGSTAIIDLAAGETVTCAFTSTKRAKLIVQEQTLPNAALESFSFTSTLAGLSGSIPNGFTLTEFSVLPGSYSVIEENPGPLGFDLTAIACDDGGSATPSIGHVPSRTATFNADPGETITCTFTNSKRGTIRIAAQTNPDGLPDLFAFTGSVAGSIADNAQLTVGNLAPGTYASTQNVGPAGFDLTAIICDDGESQTPSQTDLLNRKATFKLDAGETVTCTFTNTKRGTIAVEAQTDPDDAAGSFTFTGATAGSIGDNGRITVSNLVPGVYTSTQNDASPAFDLSEMFCDDGGLPESASSGDVETRTATFRLDAGETVTCTFVNTKRGTLVVVKDAIPNDAQDFAFTATGLSPSGFSLDDDTGAAGANGTLGTTQTFINVVPGAYSLSAAPVVGWDLTAMECVSSLGQAETAVALTLDPGETITCTSTSTKRGSISVTTDAVPNDAQDFTFTASGGLGPFTLDDDADGTLPATLTLSNVLPGSYAVTEMVPMGWDLTTLMCTDPDGGTTTVGPTATIDVDAGEAVTCTFVNTKRGRITIVQDTDPNDGQDFSFTTAGGLGAFSLDDDADATLSNAVTFVNVVPGTYSVTAAAVPGFDLTALTCTPSGAGTSAGGTVGTRTATIALAAGGDVTCTYVTTQRGSITIVQDTQPNDEQDFSFTTSGLGSFALDDDADGTLPNYVAFTNLTPGVYSVTAGAVPGFPLAALSCTPSGAGTSAAGSVPTRTASITLGVGGVVTCTFTRSKRGTITIVQDTQPDGGQDFSFTAAGLGPSGLVAAYNFEEAGGATAIDVSGTGNTATIVDATRTAGRNGQGLSFNGTSAYVRVPDAPSLHLTVSGTISAWVQQTAIKSSAGLVHKGELASFSDEAYSLQFDSSTGKPVLYVNSTSASKAAKAGSALAPAAEWHHIAATWDASGLKMFVDGVLAGSASGGISAMDSTGALFLGSQLPGAFPFSGVLDDVRLYNRALSPSEIQADMNTPVDVGNPPPGGLAFFSLDDDEDGTLANTVTFAEVAQGTYNVTEAVVPGFDLTALTCTANGPGTLATGNLITGAATITLGVGGNVICTFASTKRGTITIVQDTQPNDGQDFTFSATGGLGVFSLDDDGDGTLGNTLTFPSVTPGLYSVTEAAILGFDLTALTCSPNGAGTSATGSVSTRTASIILGAGGAVTCTFTSAQRGTITIIQDTAPNDGQDFSFTTNGNLGLSGLVAAYNFEEGSGASVADVSGNGNTGTMVSATRAPGKYGQGVKFEERFDGTTAYVRVPDADSLDLSSSGTLSAWVLQTAVRIWPGLVHKGELASFSDEAYSLQFDGEYGPPVIAGKPALLLKSASGSQAAVRAVAPLSPPLEWHHVAATWDATGLKMYIDGVMTASTPGAITVMNSSGAMFFGSQFPGTAPFYGVMDDVRVYNRALSSSEIQLDMETPLASDSHPPAGPGAFSLDDDGDGTLANTIAFPSVAAGAYSVTQLAAAGFDLTALTCTPTGTGTSASGNLMTGEATITLGAGGNVTCTFVNAKRSTLTLVRTLVNDNGGTKGESDFPLFINGTPVTSGVATPLSAGVLYTATEAGQPGYTASAWGGDCAADGTIILAPGDAKTCTITSDDVAPALTLMVKTVVNDHGGLATSAAFILTATGPTPISGPGIAASGPTFRAGTYALTESSLPGYTASPWVCTGTGTQVGSSIALQIGETATCTILNEDVPPTLTLVKTVVNDNGGTNVDSDFALFINGSPATSGVATPLSAGVLYTATQTDQPGYTASAWGGDCAADGTITLSSGDVKTCTITSNDVAPTLTLITTVVNDSGGSATPAAFTLTAAGPTPISGPAEAASGPTFSAGTYALTASSLAGYTAGPWVCTGSGTQTGPSIVLQVGQNATCTIANDDEATEAHILIVKQTLPAGDSTVFTFSASFDAAGFTLASGQSHDSGDLAPGTYSLGEANSAGWDLTSAVCSDGSPVTAVDLGPGETVTCTFTSTKRGTIVVENVSLGGNGTFNFTTTGLAPAAFSIATTGGVGPAQTFEMVVPGNGYAVSETNSEGWNLTSATCSDGSPVHAIDVGPGERVTCTFTNTKPGYGLVAAYGFNQGSGTTLTDASGMGNTGIITGATWTTAGRYGKALSFNGSTNFVKVNETPSLDLPGAMTLEAWVKPTSLTGWRPILYKESAEWGLVWALYASDKSAPPSVYATTTSDANQWVHALGKSMIPLDTWTHIAGTYDGTNLKLYVNGVLVATKARTGVTFPSANPLYIAGRGSQFAGLIDEVRIYNRALSQAEIVADSTTPLP